MKVPHGHRDIRYSKHLDRSYGIKIDWACYTVYMFILCHIPLFSRLFTHKVRIDVTGTRKSGSPIVGIHAIKHMPLMYVTGAYYLKVKLPPLSSGISSVEKYLIRIIGDNDEELACNTIDVAPGEVWYWQRYWLRDKAHKHEIEL